MDASVSDAITGFLSESWDVYPDDPPRAGSEEDRTALIEASLRTGPRFRCPGCHEFGVVGQDPAAAVLFFRFAMAGGYGGDTIMDPWRPSKPLLVRWWLTRRHERCMMAAVRPWDALPAWALPGTSPAAVTDTQAAHRPALTSPASLWRASLDPTGVPLLSWRPAVPVRHVVRSHDRHGFTRDVLVDVLFEAMTSRGGRVLDDEDLVPDSAARLHPLRDWYAQLTAPDSLTVWMPGSSHSAFRDRGLHIESRAPLGTLTGLPPSWIDAVETQHRLLLVTVPHPTDGDAGATSVADLDLFGQGGMQASTRRGQIAGGVVAAATSPDHHRHLAPTPGPARQRPQRAPAAPIDVEPLWQLALTRAATLVDDDHTAPSGPTRFAPIVMPCTGELLGTPAHMIALVLTAYCRDHDTTPDQVPDLSLAMLLADHLGSLTRWLDMMIKPTTLAGKLAVIRGTHTDLMNLIGDPTIPADVMTQLRAGTESHDWRGRPTSTRYDMLKAQARQAVERRWLTDTGRPCIGDQVLWLPPSDAHDARTGRITGLSTSTWLVRDTARYLYACYDIALDHGRRPHWQYAEDYLLLFADPTDSRARAQAAYSAGAYLWDLSARLGDSQRQTDTTDDQARFIDAANGARRRTQELLEYHPHDSVRDILATVVTADNADLTRITTTAISRLQAVAPHRAIPGEPVPGT